MQSADWLLLVSRDGVVEGVDGGAPTTWIGRRMDEIAGLSDGVRAAGRRLVRDMAQPLERAVVRRHRVDPDGPDEPSFTLLAVEAIPIRPTDVPLDGLVRQALAPLVRQAADERVSLELALAADRAACVDAEKVAWALCAVVGNALRYVRRGDGAMPGGNISVRTNHSAAQHMLSVTIQDDGPGIPPALRPFLVESDPATGRAAGVGLRLVHDIVAAHGGGMVIRSSSEPHERGTTVTLWLPAAG